MPEDLSIIDGQEIPDTKNCLYCDKQIALNVKFCNSCGASQLPHNAQPLNNSWGLLKQAALFYSIYIVVCCLSSFVDAFKTLGWCLIIEVIIAGTAVLFFTYNWSENKAVLVWRNFSLFKLAAYGAIAIVCSCVVHYSVDWLNVTVFSTDQHFYSIFDGSKAAPYLIIFFTAVTPAIFEELGFRGYLLQILLKVADKDQAVYISAFLFAIIHLSFLSLFWLIPFALFIGYIRVRENTLWYGVFFHFLFNLTACLFQLL